MDWFAQHAGTAAWMMLALRVILDVIPRLLKKTNIDVRFLFAQGHDGDV